MCGLLVLQLQQKPLHQRGVDGRALHVYLKLWFSNKSFSLKVLFPNPGLMIEHAAWLSGALFCRLWFWSVIWITNHKSSTSPITVHPLIMLIMHLSYVLPFLYLHVITRVGGLCSDGEKVSWLGAVCAADSDWNSAEALDCSQASCLSINPRHTLQLWPHWASIAAVIQLPGRETCTASQADNNLPGLENSGLLLWCQQSIFLSLLAEHRAAGGPSVV